MATVTITGLECGVNYTITAGGTLDGDLVGPRSHGTIATNPCPVFPVCPAMSKHFNYSNLVHGNMKLIYVAITTYVCK